jgi:hypothetical protein
MRDNVSAVSAEFLNLNVEAKLSKLAGNIFCGIRCARGAGSTALPSRVRKPGHMGVEAVA